MTSKNDARWEPVGASLPSAWPAQRGCCGDGAPQPQGSYPGGPEQKWGDPLGSSQRPEKECMWKHVLFLFPQNKRFLSILAIMSFSVQFSLVHSLSCVWLFVTPWTAACQASLSFTYSPSLLKLRSIESVMPSNHFIHFRPLLLLPSIFPSIKVFSSESFLCIRWPKYWSLSFSISPSNEYSGLISFMMDWLDLLAVQGTLKSFLQHHSSKASILRHSAFFIVQLSHSYMTTGKSMLWLQTFVGKRCLCFLICCLVGPNFSSKEQVS